MLVAMTSFKLPIFPKSNRVGEQSLSLSLHDSNQVDLLSTPASSEEIPVMFLARVREESSTGKQLVTEDLLVAMSKYGRERRMAPTMEDKINLSTSMGEDISKNVRSMDDGDKAPELSPPESEIRLSGRATTSSDMLTRESVTASSREGMEFFLPRTSTHTRRGIRRSTSARYINQRKKLPNEDIALEIHRNADWETTSNSSFNGNLLLNDSGSSSTSLHREISLPPRRQTCYKQRSFKRSSSSRLSRGGNCWNSDSDDSEALLPKKCSGTDKLLVDRKPNPSELDKAPIVEQLDITYRRTGPARRRLGKSSSARFASHCAMRVPIVKSDSKSEEFAKESNAEDSKANGFASTISPVEHEATALSTNSMISHLWNSDSLLLSRKREVTVKFNDGIYKLLEP